MIKAVFFDWFNTLAHFDPPREELYQKAFQEHGFELSYNIIYQGLQVGDQFILSNRKHKTVRPKTLDNRLKLYLCYIQAIEEIAGIMLPDDIQTSIIKKVLDRYTGSYALFEDAIPLFQELKSQGIIRGLITNADRTVLNLVENLGAAAYLDVIMTSEQAGAEKPAAQIFLAALQQVGIRPDDSLYVGDHYQSDILGARAVGMKALLIDRYGISDVPSDCLKIDNLKRVIEYLG